jgi:HEAT repeat protein
MKRWYITLALVIGGFFFLSAPDLSAHGGTYKGPGDTVPPGGAPAAPAAPSSPSSPSTPSTPSSPSTPATPATPASPGTPGTPSAPGKGPTTGPSGPPPTDTTTWVFWWEFNKDRFLNLKAKVHDSGTQTDGTGVLVGLGGGAKVANTQAPTKPQIQNIIVPALQALVETEDDRDIATAVMIALAKIGEQPEKAREIFTKNLDAQVQEVSETSALSYGILKDELSIPLLIGLLQDSKEAQKSVGRSEVPVRSRTFATYSLGLIGRASTDEKIKMEVADLLFNFLITDTSASKDIRVACVISLGILELPEPTELVAKLGEILAADQEDELVLAHIPNAMAKLLANVPPGDATRDQTIDSFLEILKNKKRKTLIRQSTVQAIGMVATANDPRNKEIFKVLENTADKAKDQQMKHYSAISMAYLGVADPDPDGTLKVVTEYLMDNMKKSSTPYEPWCGLALGVMAFMLNDAGQAIHPSAMDATLDKFRKTKSPESKASYAIALGLMGNEQAKNDIRDSMDRVSETTYRGYAAIALGLLNAKEHMAYISEIVEESKREPDLLKQASIGLGLMKDRNAVSKLLGYLNPEDGKKPRLAVLSAVATALGFIGDKNSVQPLVDTMGNDRITALGRAFAAVSLGMVADKDALPWNSVFGENLNYMAAVSTLVDQQTGTGILDIL